MVSRRLMQALRHAGHDARMVVAHKGSDDANVALAASKAKIKGAFIKEHLRIFTHNGFDRADLFKVSIATDGLGLARHPWVKDADIIILAWINQGLISLQEIGELAARKRVIWIMHDMWCCTGICHHAGTCTRYIAPGECGCCPLLHGAAGADDLSHRTWQRKKQLYSHGNIRFIAVSSWLAERCRQSSLMADIQVEVIPNAFNIEDFYIGSKSITPKKVVMGAARLDDPIKGLPMAIEVFNNLNRPDILPVFFGSIKNVNILRALKVPYEWHGSVSNAAELRAIYADATAVISTSRYETLPGTIIEGMAAGATAVAFDSGGQRDIIDDGTTGYLVAPYDTEAFAAALTRAVDAPFSPQTQRSAMAARFDPEKIASLIIK